MRKLFSMLMLALSFALPIMVSDDAYAQEGNITEIKWIETKGTEFLSILALENRAMRFERLRLFLNSNFDINYIARKVIGRKWRTFDNDIKGKFISVFEDYLIYVYSATPMNTSDVSFTVDRVVELGSNADGSLLSRVYANVSLPWNSAATNSPQVININFTIKQTGSDNFQILDANIAGASIVNFIKNMFNNKMQENAQNVFAVLQSLQQTVQDIQANNSGAENNAGQAVNNLAPLLNLVGTNASNAATVGTTSGNTGLSSNANNSTNTLGESSMNNGADANNFENNNSNNYE